MNKKIKGQLPFKTQFYYDAGFSTRMSHRISERPKEQTGPVRILPDAETIFTISYNAQVYVFHDEEKKTVSHFTWFLNSPKTERTVNMEPLVRSTDSRQRRVQVSGAVDAILGDDNVEGTKDSRCDRRSLRNVQSRGETRGRTDGTGEL
jgi:hypothetical protein